MLHYCFVVSFYGTKLHDIILNTMKENNNLLKIFSLLCFSMLSIFSNAQDLKTVTYVDLAKYSGKWYEISSFPQRFQKGCYCTTAEYSWSDKGYVVVENKCNKGGIAGKLSSIKGKAFVDPNSGNAKLSVQFFWPFKGKYWIIDLDDQYQYAAVGHPNRKYLWILSRTPQMDTVIYQQMLARLIGLGFDVSKLQITVQGKF